MLQQNFCGEPGPESKNHRYTLFLFCSHSSVHSMFVINQVLTQRHKRITAYVLSLRWIKSYSLFQKTWCLSAGLQQWWWSTRADRGSTARLSTLSHQARWIVAGPLDWMERVRDKYSMTLSLKMELCKYFVVASCICDTLTPSTAQWNSWWCWR